MIAWINPVRAARVWHARRMYAKKLRQIQAQYEMTRLPTNELPNTGWGLLRDGSPIWWENANPEWPNILRMRQELKEAKEATAKRAEAEWRSKQPKQVQELLERLDKAA